MPMPSASQRVSQETIASIRDVDDAEQIADLIAANILTKLDDRQQILEEFDIQRRHGSASAPF